MSTAGGTNRPSGDLDRAPPDEPWLLTDDDDDAADQDGVETDTDHTPYASMRHTSSESSFSDLLSAHLFPPADPMLIQSAATASPYPPKMYTSVFDPAPAFVDVADPMPPPPLTEVQRTPTNPRYATKVACVSCAKHKLGCDKQRPCRRCRDTGKAATCVDRPHRRRRQAERRPLPYPGTVRVYARSPPQ
ncbi:Zn(2)-C6 fungal-type domain-containing protein [Plasmodiophora brassicae]